MTNDQRTAMDRVQNPIREMLSRPIPPGTQINVDDYIVESFKRYPGLAVVMTNGLYGNWSETTLELDWRHQITITITGFGRDPLLAIDDAVVKLDEFVDSRLPS